MNRPELFARRPDFHAVFDFDPVMAEASRRKLFDQLATDRIRITGYHFPSRPMAISPRRATATASSRRIGRARSEGAQCRGLAGCPFRHARAWPAHPPSQPLQRSCVQT
ncbi:hypothetical protein ACFQU2_02810 [Siccirubricoccus deserti]